MRRSPILVCLALAAAACGGGRPRGAVLIDQATGQDDPSSLIERAADRRVFSPELEALASRSDAAVRARVAEAIGRIGDVRGAPTLARLISDPEPEVRDAAAFASVLLGPGAGEPLNAALLRQLDKEPRGEGLRVLAWAAAATGDARTLGRLAPLLDHPDPGAREGALKGLAALAVRGVEAPDALWQKVALGLRDGTEEVRLLAAFALGQSRAGADRPEEAVATLRRVAAEDPSAEVKIHAIRALAAWGALDSAGIGRAIQDPDYRVGVAALERLSALGAPLRCALAERALDILAAALEADPELIAGPDAQKLVAGLEIGAGCPGAAAIAALAGRIADQTGRMKRPWPAVAGRIFCLSRLVRGSDDIALLGCDPARPSNGKKMVLQRILLRGESADQDLEIVRGMASEDDLAAAVEAIRALGRIDRPEASAALIDALGDPRAVAVTAALDAIAAHPDRFAAGPASPEPGLRQRLLGEVDRVVDRFGPFEHAHGPLIAAALALKAIADPAAGPILRRLAGDLRPAVRRAVLEAFSAIDGIAPPAGLAPTEAPGPASDADRIRLRLARARAVITTSRGEISVSLHSALAPAAVQSFQALARSGYFDGAPISRVVPGALVEAGDPTGTGLGDPGYGLPGSPGPAPVLRGTIIMARPYDDAEGGRFFVTLCREPALDGGYTILGQAASGLEPLDLLSEGDRIQGISVTID